MLLHVSDMKFAREQTVRLRIEFTVFLAGYSFWARGLPCVGSICIRSFFGNCFFDFHIGSPLDFWCPFAPHVTDACANPWMSRASLGELVNSSCRVQLSGRALIRVQQQSCASLKKSRCSPEKVIKKEF